MGAPRSNDLQLVRRALGGDAAAVAEVTAVLTRATNEAMKRVRVRSNRIRENDEDLVQQFLLTMLEDDKRALHSYAGRAPLAGWVRVIATRFFLRSAGRIRSTLPESEAPERADEGPSPEIITETRELVARLTPVVQALPADDRLLLSLVFQQELSASDAAPILGVKPAGVRMRKKRLLERLADALLGASREISP